MSSVPGKDGKIIEEEKMEKGRTPWLAFMDYMSSIGLLRSIIVLALFVIGTGINTASNFWLANWADSVEQTNTSIEETTKRFDLKPKKI